jgi:hypothetical protein
MRQFMIVLGLLISILRVSAEDTITYSQVDSTIHVYYNDGKWDDLISLGNKALKQGIDYKALRQLMGYSYFMKEKYYLAQKQYEKALEFDTSDGGTKLYLYYCGLYSGDDTYTRYRSSFLLDETKKYFKIKSTKVLDAVDVEYNYKSNNSKLRTNPSYYRLGLNTQLFDRLSIYQAGSFYKQGIEPGVTASQAEYYVKTNFILSPYSTIDAAYHYVHSNVNKDATTRLLNDTLKGDLFYAKYSTRISFLNLSLGGSVLRQDTVGFFNRRLGNKYFDQLDASVGFSIPKALHLTFKSSVSYLFQLDNSFHPYNTRWVFSQKLGFAPLKSIWVEANVTNGNLMNYQDNDALYLYNSPDATTFRVGGTVFLSFLNHFTLFGNYGFDKKELINTDLTKQLYNQHSISGGVIWKL